MRTFLGLFIFILLQLLFLPLALVGFVLVGYKQVMVSKKLGVSMTAIEVLNGRWTMHIFGIRDDDSAAQLASVLPNTSTFGLWLCLFPYFVYTRIRGQVRSYPAPAKEGEEGIMALIPSRTVFLDQIIERTQGQVEQFVVLGAGLDTRAYGMLKDRGLALFELDQANNQNHKRHFLQQAGIDSSHVTFAPTDFSQETWFHALLEKGYDPKKRTLFLWEGVTLYLSESSVRRTLQDLKANANDGSIVVADIYSKRFVTGEYAPGMKPMLPILDATNEALSFGLRMTNNPESTLREFAESEGWSVGESHFLGKDTKKGAWMVVVELNI